MTLKKRQVGDVHLLTPQKDLRGGKETDELSAEVQEIVATGVPKIVVDLGDITWMSSMGLSALVRGHVSCTNRQGWFRVARTTKKIDNLFLITKLALVLETFETVEEALSGEHTPDK